MERVLENKENGRTNRKSHTQEDLSMSTFSDSSSLNENDIAYGGQQNGTFKPEKELQLEGGTEYKKQALARGQFASENNVQTSPISSPGSLGGDEFALVVNGHSLVYALGPELELLFLGVAEKCSCKFKRYFLNIHRSKFTNHGRKQK